jgi:hypothetical protein
VLARHGGIGGFDRRIVGPGGRQHLPRIGAPHHGELAGREGGVGFFFRGAGRELALGGRSLVDLVPGEDDLPGLEGGENRRFEVGMTVDNL